MDEATSEHWGHTFTNKNTAFKCLEELETYTQKQWGNFRQIKAWRMDGGKEYAPIKIKQTCIHLGQRLKISITYAPWQDGKVERSIRIIIEKVRKSMIAIQIPAFLWTKISKACIYITNRNATSTVKSKTPVGTFLDQVDPDH